MLIVTTIVLLDDLMTLHGHRTDVRWGVRLVPIRKWNIATTTTGACRWFSRELIDDQFVQRVVRNVIDQTTPQ